MIDDFFIVTQEPIPNLDCVGSRGALAPTLCRERLSQALDLYWKVGVEGSPEKDVANALVFTVAGAQVNSSREALRRKQVTVAVPAEKRLALAHATLAATSFRVSSRALLEKIVGSWVHCMMYRRPTTVCFARIYKVIYDEEVQALEQDKLFRLPRSVPTELVVASILAPLMASNLSARLTPRGQL